MQAITTIKPIRKTVSKKTHLHFVLISIDAVKSGFSKIQRRQRRNANFKIFTRS